MARIVNGELDRLGDGDELQCHPAGGGYACDVIHHVRPKYDPANWQAMVVPSSDTKIGIIGPFSSISLSYTPPGGDFVGTGSISLKLDPTKTVIEVWKRLKCVSVQVAGSLLALECLHF